MWNLRIERRVGVVEFTPDIIDWDIDELIREVRHNSLGGIIVNLKTINHLNSKLMVLLIWLVKRLEARGIRCGAADVLPPNKALLKLLEKHIPCKIFETEEDAIVEFAPSRILFPLRSTMIGMETVCAH